MTTTIDLLRHGEAAPGLCLGRDFDAPLTAMGWAQMRGVVNAVVSEASAHPCVWDGVVSSPLRRCADFAKELSDRHGLPLRREPRWRELGFGAWEGKPWADLYQDAGGPLLAFQSNPLGSDNPAPGGEHYPDFECRVVEAWDGLLEAALGGHWLLVAHAGVLRVVLRRILGFPPTRLFSIQIPPACLVRIERQNREPPRLVFHRGKP